jgi:hypothetical protein
MRRLLPVLLLAAAAVPAYAAMPSRSGAQGWTRAQFAAADRNRDGALSRGEVTAAVNRHYGRLSTGRSRILTNMWFNRLDRNKSNSVSRSEADAALAEFWGRFDRNRDGRFNPREEQAARAFLQNPAR